MAHLTLAGLSDDGKRLLLVDDRGVEHTLAIDATLRAALRGEHARIGQLEIKMDSSLRPRDIQARIRAGETPEAVAQAAQTTVDRILVYAGPVMDERAHVARRAQSSSVRRRSGESGARTLGEAVEAQLRGANVDPDTVEWDAWRREDGRWTLTGAYDAGSRSGTATFTYDMRGSFVTMDDEDAKWLVGESTSSRRSGEGGGSRGRRLSAVPAEDELPLGEDAISLVADEPEQETGDEETAASPADSPTDSPTDSPAETTLDLGRADVEDDETEARQTAAPEETDTPEQPAPEPPAASEPPAEPPVRKPARRRGRASVPSWDEIMFGGSSEGSSDGPDAGSGDGARDGGRA